MDFRILGPLSVVDDDGAEVSLSGTRLRSLLALLLVRYGESVTADRLADDLWGDELPAGWANALQSLVSKLRRNLGASGRLLVTTGNGYRLDVAPADIDAARFSDAVARGRAELESSDARAAASTLAAALSLWRGDALDGPEDGMLRREATRLDELRLGAIEDRIDADLRIGRHAERIAELGALVTAHPLRERLHGFLMLALYRAGRQGEALRAYQDAREALAEELGLDPAPELRELETSILNQDPALDLATPASVPPPRRQRTNIVRGLSSFIGRENEVKTLAGIVDCQRLVTVIGPGGAGKTRIAVEVAAARGRDEDVWFVDLAPVRSVDAVAETVAVTVGVADGVLPGPAQSAGLSTIDRVADHLAERETLVVLDNCEHVIGEAARIAERLLVSCPLLKIVATSREALGIRGETLWPMPPMSIGDAVALFVDRAASTSGFTLVEDNERTVGELCGRLDGLPLAIELAAGRVRAIPVHQLASRLDDRFRLLTGGARNALPRQQTLRAVVEWSYDLLFDDEQRVFERLSVFAGGCSLEAAEVVCGGDDIAREDVADILAHLVDKSLVIADHSGSEVRFRLLQTLALYGRERLGASDDAHGIRARHAALFGDVCRRGRDVFRGSGQEPWLAEVEREIDNIHAALTWVLDRGDALTAQRMLGGLGWSWWFAGRGGEGWRWLTAGLECPGETTNDARAAAAMWAGYVGACAGVGMEVAVQYGEEAVALLRATAAETGVDGELKEALILLGGIRLMMAHNDEAIRLFDEAHELFGRHDDPWNRALALNCAGRAAELRGDIALAYEVQCRSVDCFESAGVDWALAVINGDVGVLALRLGRFDDAVDRTERARRAASFLRLGGYESVLLSRLGGLVLANGDIDRADQLMTEALELAEAARFRTAEAYAHVGSAIVRRTQGRFDEAVESAKRAAELFEATGLRSSRAQALATIGFVAQQRGDTTTALAFHSEALGVGRQTGNKRGIALAVEGLAGVAAVVGEGQRAAELLGAAQAVREADGGGPPGPDSEAPNTRQVVIDLIGSEAFDIAITRGRSASLDALL